MTLHMLKLCVGVDRIDELEDWIEEKIRKAKSKGKEPKLEHVTRQMPKRRDEILEGGSLYWVIKGFIQVRQPIVGLQARRGKDGIERCAIQFAPNLVQVQPSPRRAFQGWRYLEAKDAPADLGKRRKGEQELPPALLLELRQLGIL
ncbi:hypothetical protein FRZ44_28920 [Hypericibacter terrae]|uniref:Lysophospholipase n=1 Tax=Hypericibacter terrae TaxID=2602015 RepID=A0A5J6MNE8_9PROT|nr:DUF1489 domain-containing protein [Hypericibacter terrae]QEX17590.1 hypothetical protein FRZ44_28920 [Hypericibacter terrae]